MRYIKTRPKSQSAFKVVKEIAASVLFFVRDKKKLVLVKKRALASNKRVVKARPKCLCAQAKGVCIYVQSRDNFDCLYFFVVSFYPFFLFGEKKDSMEYLFISWDKKTIVVVQKVAAFEREKKKIGFIILHTLYKAFTAGVGVQKGRRL